MPESPENARFFAILFYISIDGFEFVTEIRVENEIKMLSTGGPFAFSGTDSVRAVNFLRGAVSF